MSLRLQAISGFRWSASVKLVSQVITWSITLVVVRLLSPSDYGLLAMAMVCVSFLTMFSEMGLGVAIVQKSDMDELLLRRVFGAILLVHFSIAVLLALSAPLIAHFYAEPKVLPVIQVLSLQFVFAAFAVIPDAQLQRRMEFRQRALLDLYGAIIASVSTLALALAGTGVWALVAGSLINQVIKTLGINWLSPFARWPYFSISGIKNLLRFGGHLSGSQVCWMLFTQVDLLICARWLGNEALGFYSVAMHLATLPSQRISSLVNQVAFPAFSRMQDDVEKMGSNVLLGVRILSFVAFPLLWGMSSIAQEIVELVLGLRWTASIVPFQVLALVAPVRLVANFVQVAIQGMGRSDILLRNAVWALVSAPIFFLVGVSTGGLLGLSLAWLLLSPLVALQVLHRALPVLRLRHTQLGMIMLPPAIAALIMCGALTLARQWLLYNGQSSGVRLAVLIALGALVYGAASFKLNRTSFYEVIGLGKSVITVAQHP
jgi:teichuronic acid exporter